LKGSSRENYGEAIRLFERALALDPQSILARSLSASLLAIRILDQLAETPDADVARAEKLIDEALADSPTNP
jgi:tetratricopeptide (TPR) repeat protein